MPRGPVDVGDGCARATVGAIDDGAIDGGAIDGVGARAVGEHAARRATVMKRRLT